MRIIFKSMDSKDFLCAWWGGQSRDETDIKLFVDSPVNVPSLIEFMGKVILYKKYSDLGMSVISKSSKSNIPGFDGAYILGDKGLRDLFIYEAKSSLKNYRPPIIIEKALSDFKDVNIKAVKSNSLTTFDINLKSRSLVDLSVAKKIEIDENDFKRMSKSIDGIFEIGHSIINSIASVNSQLAYIEKDIEDMLSSKHPDTMALYSIIFDMGLEDFKKCHNNIKEECYEKFPW